LTVYCTRCGMQNPDDSRFCSQCGAQLVRTGESSTPVDSTSVINFDDPADAPDAVEMGQLGAVDALPTGTALLVVKRGPNAGSRFLLDQDVTTAGRHPDSDIFLDDATVSRHHVEFRLENGQFLLVDLDSLNNTYVNHEPVDSAVLVNGDEIQIGKFRLVFLTRPTTG